MLMPRRELDMVRGRLVGQLGQLLYPWINATSHVGGSRSNLRVDVDGMGWDAQNGM